MIRLYRWIVGSIRITLPSAETERVLNFALKYNFPVWNVKRNETEFSFSLFPRHRKYFYILFRTLSSDFQWQEREEGTRTLFRRFGKRWGLMLGMAVFAISLIHFY